MHPDKYRRSSARIWKHVMRPYQKLQQYWTQTNAGISTSCANEEMLDSLERKYGIRLPDEFRDYLTHSCPTDQSNSDQNLVSWWPLKRIKNIVDECEHPIRDAIIARDAAKYLFFADYSIWCWAWAIACGDDQNRGKVVVISGNDRFVSASFGQFVDRYIEDLRQVS
jgi:hypothetical protein